MENIFSNLGLLLVIAAIICILVLCAIGVDFASGLYKSTKVLGQPIQSSKLRKTINKAIIYEGATIIGLMIDCIIYFAVWQFSQNVYKVPLITCLFGIVIMLVEVKSVKERAEEKQQRDATEIANGIINILGNVVSKESLTKIVTDVIKERENDK